MPYSLVWQMVGCYEIGPIRIEKGMIYMPGRLKMFYHELQFIKDEGWTLYFARQAEATLRRTCAGEHCA